MRRTRVDDAYADELAAFRTLGVASSLFSFEDFETGTFNSRPALAPEVPVVYRGWMLHPDAYTRLDAAVAAGGARLRTSPAEYRLCHHLPEWYALCRDLTPETVVVPRHADFVAALAGHDWPAYFVKDYVKSLSTTRGSVAATPQDVAEVVSLIEQYRRAIEGGVCIRRFERFVAGTEERYFVVNDRAHAREGEAPPLAHELARRIPSPFFSVDLVMSESGGLRLIELGDGQVSDRKRWTPDRFARMIHAG